MEDWGSIVKILEMAGNIGGCWKYTGIEISTVNTVNLGKQDNYI